MTVAVRKATKKDARTVAEFAVKLFAQHRQYDSRRFIEITGVEGAEHFYGSQTEKKDAAILVAEIENKIVGFAYVQYEKLNYSSLLENAAWLHDLYVEENARGRDAGKLLIEKAIEIGKEMGADKLMLSVAARNEHAKEFFEHHGFRATMIEMMLDLTDENKV
jgi:ribosomal protein S18 acetylase RimI-like enzyme